MTPGATDASLVARRWPRRCSPLVAAFADHHVVLLVGRRPGRRLLGDDASAPETRNLRQHHQQRVGALPRRPRGRHRVPDEPVQHRRRGPVPRRVFARRRRRRRGAGCRASSTRSPPLLVAMLVGAAWAGIAGVLQATRGVSEVISTIMLNAIAMSLVAYLLRQVGVREEGSNTSAPRRSRSRSRVAGFALPGRAPTEVYGLVFIAVLCGVGFWVLLNRTRFGFDLRATGQSQTAAVASGVDVKRMIDHLDAALRGGRRPGRACRTSSATPTPTARRSRRGSASPASRSRCSAATTRSASPLARCCSRSSTSSRTRCRSCRRLARHRRRSPRASIVLTVVIAYEVVRRYGVALEQRQVAQALESTSSAEPEVAA